MKRTMLLFTASVLLAGALLLSYAYLRPNTSRIDPRLQVETWDIVADGEHNSNTDMVLWKGDFLLIHAASPYHLGTPRSRLLVKRSADGHRWERLAVLRVEGRDIRDPKVVEIDGLLFLYALPNEGVYATPLGTVLSTSEDGRNWTPFEPVGPEGWLFWRPKTKDGRTWYMPAYWHEHGESILLRSKDGRNWERVSTIHRGEANDETAIEFLPDNRLLATARLEIHPDTLFGNADASTLIAVAEPPYTKWTKTRSQVTRLDGPVLFRYQDTIFAVARYQPGPRRPWSQLGSTFSRKRTSIFRVETDRLIWLSDLPSAGDTSYAGTVIKDGSLWIDYYTSRIDRDYPWLLGMLLPTDIRMARTTLEDLVSLSGVPGVTRKMAPQVNAR